MAERALFGNAFSAVLPPGANDASVVRQIPDNQEVFTHPHTDQSVIIELLEAVDTQAPDEVAIKTHFDDIASSNGAEDDAKITYTEQLTAENLAMHQAESSWYIVGEQNIAKFNEAAKNTIELHMGLFRLPQFETDVLITFNDPLNISVDSSSHHAVPTSVVRWHKDDFRNVLATLKLNDTGIFGV